MSSEKKSKLSLDALPDVGTCEKKDIVHSMKDKADSDIQWIKDYILDKHKKRTENERLSARTRMMVQLKAYETYLRLHGNIRSRVRKTANRLLSEINLR